MTKSPNKRALDDLRTMGFTCQTVERWNSFARKRIDLFGCIDIVAARDGIGLLAVQACAGASHAARRTKSLAEPRLRVWLMAGGRFEIWSYAKRGARGKAKKWELRREEILLGDLPPDLDPPQVAHAATEDDLEAAVMSDAA